MPPLETTTNSPGETPEVPQDHVSTGEESSGSGTYSTKILGPVIDGRGIPKGPGATCKVTGVQTCALPISSLKMGLISPGGENLLDFLELLRCSRLTTGTSGTRSGGFIKGQSPCQMLGGFS